jgi:hypothetical protein
MASLRDRLSCGFASQSCPASRAARPYRPTPARAQHSTNPSRNAAAAPARAMAQDIQFPENGNGRIEVGQPAWWNVDLTGRPQQFDISVIARADYGKKWHRSVRVVFDD